MIFICFLVFLEGFVWFGIIKIETLVIKFGLESGNLSGFRKTLLNWVKRNNG